MDTIEGGKWLPDQDLAWTLVTKAVERVTELENEIGCFFDRNPDGTLHGKAFAGQTFDRTVHKGDLTGIEIINRLMEQVWARPAIRRLEEHRAVALVPAKDGAAIAGVLLVDIRTGAFRFVAAQAVLLATGGGPTMYRYHTPSGDKSMDGLAMALRVGPAAARHGDGAVPSDRAARRSRHAHDRHRAGGGLARRRRISAQRRHAPLHGRLRSAARARHPRRGQPRDVCRDAGRAHDPARRALHQDGPSRPRERGESSSRAWWSAAPTAASTSPAGWWKSCRRRTISWVAWSARPTPSTELPGLFVAGEDASGMHGANRLGGNGVANSTVFGGIAGDTMPRWIKANPGPPRARRERARGRGGARAAAVHAQAGRPQPAARKAARHHVGRCRRHPRPRRARSGARRRSMTIEARAAGDRPRRRRPGVQPDLARLAQPALAGRDEPRDRARRAQAREFSRGAHFREDFPDPGELATSTFTVARQRAGKHRDHRRAGPVHHRASRRDAAQGSGRRRIERGEHDPDLRPSSAPPTS